MKDALELRNAVAQKVADVRVDGKALQPNESDYAVADALLPLIREVQAEALEEAAAFLKPTGVVWYGDGGVTVYADGAYGGNRMDLIDWLNFRAAAYRVGES